MRLARIAQRLTELSVLEWRTLSAAFVHLWRARIGLWTMPFARMYRNHMEEAEARARNRLATTPTLSATQIAWSVHAASRLVPQPTCLVKALATHRLLRSAGYPSIVHIGVQRDSTESFGAHAWVESNQRIVIGGRQAVGFMPLPQLNRSDIRGRA